MRGGGLVTAFLFLERAAETEHVAVVVLDLESAQAVVGVGEFAVHGDVSGDVFAIQRVGIGGVDVGIPARAGVAGMIGLRVNFGCDVFEHEHDAVAPHDAPEVLDLAVAAAFVGELEAELGGVEVERGWKAVDDEEGGDVVEQGGGHADRYRSLSGNSGDQRLPRIGDVRCGSSSRRIER